MNQNCFICDYEVPIGEHADLIWMRTKSGFRVPADDLIAPICGLCYSSFAPASKMMKLVHQIAYDNAMAVV